MLRASRERRPQCPNLSSMSLPVPSSACSFPDRGAATVQRSSPRLVSFRAHTHAPSTPKRNVDSNSVGVGGSSRSVPSCSAALAATAASIMASPLCRVLPSKPFPCADASKNSTLSYPAAAGLLLLPHRSPSPTGQFSCQMALGSPSDAEQSFARPTSNSQMACSGRSVPLHFRPG